MQALSQLSYCPINDHQDLYPDARTNRAWNLRGGVSVAARVLSSGVTGGWQALF
jgi:hypothetical protein